MKKIAIVGLLLALITVSGCTLFKVNVLQEVQPLAEKTIGGRGKGKVLVLDISGVIMGGATSPGLSAHKKPGLVPRVREALDKARRDRDVKAVVLRINSPGGGVTASDTLYHELMRFKHDTGDMVIAHIMDVGASGAYYAALAADAITAQPTSVTGSIGVIMYRVDITELMQKAGIRAAEIASGARKGEGSPFRPITDDERRLFQSIIDSLYARFTGLVAEQRRLTPDAVRKLADGRIFTSREAKDAGLIDGIGYLEDAITLAKHKAHLAEATEVMYYYPGEYRSNLYSLSLVNLDLGEFAASGARFLYLWWP